MQDLAMFDVIIILITLFLGLKGFFKGFIKEVFALLGIIGAIFVASRVSFDVGQIVAPVLAIENSSTIKLIGFIISVVAVWFIVYVAGILVSKIFSLSGLGVIDRLFGLVFGAAKIFLIFSVIASALYSIDSFRKSIDENFKNSIVMPHLLSVGEFIMKIDTSVITDNLDDSVKESVNKMADKAKVLKDTSDILSGNQNQNTDEDNARQAQQLEDEKTVEEKRENDINNEKNED
ncbi:CvpA family protein [Arcobacter porcinus]|uniref:Colicin V production protein n=1 Tax=Arcobacter porcinus TaxID=1935204 RepID=A0A1C0B100_9BACT|nr:CvpA family protein [Arcobacter porcinus]OCL89705.1 Colicin V production protein [Aliarcobacter thereius]OCL81580.1 Colicin V production protein [Arcobacter porcinus]OCL87199.1 Colicin V production protein [Arcobacter porcinus]OCL93483.1 Colicin V production protein [Arcobacter porcinus]QEP40157.1 CvpA family membrane protein [Arcobacter porcinus]